MPSSINAPLSRPWFKQFWPWFLIALPATAVVGGIITLIIAAHEPDGLVVDDYYKQGLAINRELELDRQAAALDLTALVRLDTDSKQIVVSLQNTPAQLEAQELTLRMIHPTRPNLDRTLSLQREAADRWSAPFDGAAQGRWHLQLEPEARDWRVSGRLLLPQQQQVLLRPQT